MARVDKTKTAAIVHCSVKGEIALEKCQQFCANKCSFCVGCEVPAQAEELRKAEERRKRMTPDALYNQMVADAKAWNALSPEEQYLELKELVKDTPGFDVIWTGDDPDPWEEKHSVA